MICIICRKEIVGPYIQLDKRPFSCKHITCGAKFIVAKSEVIAVPKNVVMYNIPMYKQTATTNDPDSIIEENIIGGLNDKK